MSLLLPDRRSVVSDPGGGLARQTSEPVGQLGSSGGLHLLQDLFQDIVSASGTAAQAWVGAMEFDGLGVCRPDKVGTLLPHL